jgi:hypothetical protein
MARTRPIAPLRPTAPGPPVREGRAALGAYVVRWLLLAVVAGLVIGALLRILG